MFKYFHTLYLQTDVHAFSTVSFFDKKCINIPIDCINEMLLEIQIVLNIIFKTYILFWRTLTIKRRYILYTIPSV